MGATPKYSSWPIDDNAEYVVVGMLGQPKIPRSRRSTVLTYSGQLYVIIDELVPDAPGLLCFDTIVRSGWDSWNPIRPRPLETQAKPPDNKIYLRHLRKISKL
jgi:hypothetical protein